MAFDLTGVGLSTIITKDIAKYTTSSTSTSDYWKLISSDILNYLQNYFPSTFPSDQFIMNGTSNFNGNVNVNGNVIATSYYGNGSALTGISPSAIVTLSGTSVTISQITASTMFTVDASLNADQTVDITAGANSKYTVIFQNPSSYLSTITLKTGVTYVLNPMNTLMLSYDGTQWEIINSPSGAAIGNWTSYTLAIKDDTETSVISASPGNATAKYRRVGSNCEVSFTYYHTTTVGTAGTNRYHICLPPGLLIDLTQMSSRSGGNSGQAVGKANGDIGGGTLTAFDVCVGDVITGCGLWFPDLFRSGGTFAMNTTFLGISGTFSVPIQGWGSNINLVSDFTEYVYNTQSGINTNGTSATYAQGPAGANIVANTAQTYYDVLFLTPVKSTDEVLIDICEGGFWALSQNRLPYGTEGASINRGIRGIWVSSTVYRVYFSTYSEGLNPWSVFAALKWRVRKISNGNFAEVPSIPHLEVYGNSGQTSVSSVSLTVIFLTVLVDSHNGYNPATGIYTAPQSGYYQVNVGMMFNYDAWAVSPDTTLVVVGGISNKNVVYKTIPVNAALAYVDMGGSTTIKCVAGAQIYTIVSHTSGSNKSLFPNAYGPYTYMDITWLGK